MKRYLTLLTAGILGLIFMQSNIAPTAQSIHDFTMNRITGEEASLEAYAGKVVLVVNVASKCGYTPQYADLQALYEKYEEKGLVILGFPANNFMGQEPGTNSEIASFCQKNYGVSFPMFEKISVKGKDQHPLYGYLAETTGEQPKWNFHKYLVNKEGVVTASFTSGDNPMGDKVIGAIEELL